MLGHWPIHHRNGQLAGHLWVANGKAGASGNVPAFLSATILCALHCHGRQGDGRPVASPARSIDDRPPVPAQRIPIHHLDPLGDQIIADAV